MVDFNSDVMVGMPAIDIERVSILQRRYEFIDAFEFYKKKGWVRLIFLLVRFGLA